MEVRRDEGGEEPYRWLEDAEAEETRAFVAAQNALAEAFLDGPSRAADGGLPRVPDGAALRRSLRAELAEVYEYAKYSAPFVEGGRTYFYLRDGLQDQPVLMRACQGGSEDRAAPADAPAEPFLDPNALAPGGSVSVDSVVFSHDGALAVYAVARAGSDWLTAHVRDAASSRDRPDVLRWIKFSGFSWTHDHRGFFYCRYPAPPRAGGDARSLDEDVDVDVKEEEAEEEEDAGRRGTEVDAHEHHSIYYHRLGDPQDRDVLVHRCEERPAWLFGAAVTEDGRFVVRTTYDGCLPANLVHVAELAEGGAVPDGPRPLSFVPLVQEFSAQFHLVANDGPRFYFRSTLGAPRGRVIALDLASPSNVLELVPEHPADVLVSAAVVAGDTLLLLYTRDVCSVLFATRLACPAPAPRLLPLPGLGTLADLSGRRSLPQAFFKFTSFLDAGTILCVEAGSVATYRCIQLAGGVDTSKFTVEQVFYRSKDGTRVPMFIVRPAAQPRDGRAPVFLYGYGGFEISISPAFNPFRLVLMQRLGVTVAVANLRGGGEYGEAWHEAGMRDRKQNVFDDFYAAAEFLVAERYAAPGRICICGGSNGGLLVGAAITQRPELFGAAVAQVGVFDMLRFHKFTIGRAWCSDYGDPDNAADRAVLLRYSPLHNVRAGRPVPPTLLTTADHDDRVSPLHSYKFAAELQHVLGRDPAQLARGPILLRVYTDAGHGAGKPTTKTLDETAEIYTFVALALDIAPVQ